VRFRDDRGQAVTEVALIVPLLLVLVLGFVELTTAFNTAITIAAATREGARVAGALVNGGGALGCGAGQSANAATVDPLVVAAVQRVLTGSGAHITLVDVSAIRIYKATASGGETSGSVNQWVYLESGGPVIAGQALDFVEQSNLWPACGRTNANPGADSAGITVRYTYRGGTPLRYFIPGLASLSLTEFAVMPLNASR
jgi:hypothetical protein